MSLLIYIAGPYSAPTEEGRMENVMEAIRAGLEIIRRGHVPFIPHMSHFLGETARLEQDWEIPYEEWMRQDFAVLYRCDALLYLAPSPGADRELARAQEQGLPIFRTAREIPEVTG